MLTFLTASKMKHNDNKSYYWHSWIITETHLVGTLRYLYHKCYIICKNTKSWNLLFENEPNHKSHINNYVQICHLSHQHWIMATHYCMVYQIHTEIRIDSRCPTKNCD